MVRLAAGCRRRSIGLHTMARIGFARIGFALATSLVAVACDSELVDPPAAVTPIGFRVDLATTNLTASVGSNASMSVLVTRVGPVGEVTLSAGPLPQGVTASIIPATLSGTQTTAVLTLSAGTSAAPATSSITILSESRLSTGDRITGAPAALTFTVIAAANPPTPVPPTPTAATLTVLGRAAVNERYTSEVWVRGTTAYTSTWGTRGGVRGNTIKIWDVTQPTPVLVDSVLVANATTTGDVQVSDDGSLLVVAIESNPNGGLAVYSLANPRAPQLLVRTTGGELQYGVHTAEVARVNGTLYAFCAVDPANGVPSRLVIMSLANPAVPQTVFSQVMGNPFIHDVFVRDGLLFTAEWNDGTGIWDIGAQGGSPASPRRISRPTTIGGKVHNMWWVHDPATSRKQYLMVGEEGPGVIGSSSVGDVHVLDLTNLNAPVEVARFTVPGAGTHNFSVDEANGLLYAAFYNGGVRVLDVRGDLGTCTAAQRTPDGRCDLGLMGREVARFTGTATVPNVYVWGVHWSSSGVFASDMLHGLWRLAPATR